METIDTKDAIENDKAIKEGYEEYEKLDKLSLEIAQEMSATLLDKIVKESGNNPLMSLSTMIVATAKTLTHLAGYYYDNEKEFLDDVQRSREAVVADIVPALLHPEPCGECANCKDGRPDECLNVKVTPEYTTSRILPIIANMLIEYDAFNKTLWMHTSEAEAEMQKIIAESDKKIEEHEKEKEEVEEEK